jgi:uncharacterized protein YkwD
MSVNNKYEHSDRTSTNYAECLSDMFAWETTSYHDFAKMKVEGWMDSPRHKEILLDKSYTEGGTHTHEYVETVNPSVLRGFAVRSTFCLK